MYNNFITRIFEWGLSEVYAIVGSYGWAIVVLTIIARLITLPLDIKSKKSTREQQRIQPQITALQKKYANDKETLNKKTTELYKKEGFSPLAGCLPLIVQMPILFAFFGALRNLAGGQMWDLYETAKASEPIVLEGFLWIKNLWQSDTMNAALIPAFTKLQQYTIFKDALEAGTITEVIYNSAFAPAVELFKGQTNGFYILPALACAMSFLQSKLAMPAKKDDDKKAGDTNPAAGTGKMMQYMMPVMSLVICLSQSAAFALYWTVSSLIAVINYLVMNRIFAAQEAHQEKIVIEEIPSRKMERKLPKI